MEKAKTRRVPGGMALALLVATLLLPEVALADDDAESVSQFTDSSSERSPAVTAFPKYPAIARRDRIEGETIVCFNIDARGRVLRPSIRSSSHRIFDKPVMRAIRRSSFEALPAGEKPAVAKTCRTYRFRLDPISAQNGKKAAPTGVGAGTAGDAAEKEPAGQRVD